MIHILTSYFVQCDLCKKGKAIKAVNQKDLLRTIHKRGWKAMLYDDDLRTICPSCPNNLGIQNAISYRRTKRSH